MNQKVQELIRTLVQSGIAASESEAKRMAEEMVSTEARVQEDFDDKRDKETMYGNTPRFPKRPGQGELNHNNNNPRPLNNEVKTNPVDGTPITPVSEQKPRDNVGMVKVENPHMTPEEYSASRLNVAKSTSELIKEEDMIKKPEEENQQPVQETDQVNSEQQPVQETKETQTEELVIPRPDDPIAEESNDENKNLPNLNPLEDNNNTEQAVTSQNQAKEPEVNNSSQAEEKPKMTPEEYTAMNRNVGSDGKELPQTSTPDRPQKSKEELEKMEESKVDLTKIFKV